MDKRDIVFANVCVTIYFECLIFKPINFFIRTYFKGETIQLKLLVII